MDHLKLPPQNIDAEQSVIGGIMLEQDAWDEICDVITEEDFYKPSHRKIFASIKTLKNQNNPTDLVTISNALMSADELDKIGGPAYLAELIDRTPSAANILSYAKIVKDKSMLRKIISKTSAISEKAFAEDFEDLPAFIDRIEQDIYAISDEGTTSNIMDSSELVKLSLEKLEELYANKGQITGIPSGFYDFDEMTAGFHSAELSIIAARPSMGKTAYSVNIAMHAALREKKSVAYFSVEMGKEQLMIRMLAAEAQIPLSDMRVGSISDAHWPKLINTAAKISDAKIFIDDTAGLSPYELRAKARRLKARHGLDMIMVDYLQLMSLKTRVESREREVSEISKTLKAIAKELQVPVIALAQLNRSVEGRSDRRPMLSDLRESGSIEQDADIICMLFREDYYDRDNPDIKGLAEVIIGKQRNGPTGTVKLRWQPEYGLFKDVAQSMSDAPMPPSGAYNNSDFGNSNMGGAPSANSPSDEPKPTSSGPKNFAPGS